MSNNHLLVLCETSHQKERLINSFQQFEIKYGYDCSAIIRGIENHNKYITNGSYYFKFNSKLSFLQKFRSKKEDVLKLNDFYKTFDKSHTYFWTITKKTFPLEKIVFIQGKKKTKIEFEEINTTEKNLRQLLWRLERYGYYIKKYILVPEIKDNAGLFNYHYHIILEAWPDILKIRANKNKKYQSLVYNERYNQDLSSGWINNPVLSQIWKDITKDGSYRIKPERIQKEYGVFHYCLSYMNKGIQYDSFEAVPYMYFALKSKKAYRIKGLKKIPKIKFEVLTAEGEKIFFNYFNLRYIEKQEIPIEMQEYILNTFKDDKRIETKNIVDYFVIKDKKNINGNELISNFDKKLIKNKYVFTKKYNWEDVEKTFTQLELTKMQNEGLIFESKDGYMLL